MKIDILEHRKEVEANYEKMLEDLPAFLSHFRRNKYYYVDEEGRVGVKEKWKYHYYEYNAKTKTFSLVFSTHSSWGVAMKIKGR